MNRNSRMSALGRFGVFALLGVLFVSLFATIIRASGSAGMTPPSSGASGSGGSSTDYVNYVMTDESGKGDDTSQTTDGENEPLWSYDTGSDVLSVSISSDGSYIAASSGNNVYLFSKDNSSPLWSYDTNGDVYSVSISSDGSYIAAGSGSSVYLFSKVDNTPLWSYTTDADVYSVSISSDGNYIAAGGYPNVYLFCNDTTPPTYSVDPSELYFSGGYETELRVTIHEDQSRSGLTYKIYYRYWTIGYPFYIDEDGRPVYVDSDGRIYYLDSLDFPENYYPPMIDWTLWCDDCQVDWYDGYGVATVQFYPVRGRGYYQFCSIAIDGAGNADWQSFGNIPSHDDFSGLYNDFAHRIDLRVDEQALDPDSAYVEYSYKVSCDCSVGIEEGQVKLQGLSSETGQWETLYLKPPPILEGVVAAELPPNEYSRVGLYIYAELEGGSSINGLFTVMWNRTIT